MSHSSGASLSAMQVMIVVMVMALLTTTSHCININSSIVSGGGYSSSSSCNGLTATACRIAYSELDFDSEFMLDSEFSIRILTGANSPHKIDLSKIPGKAASCGPGDKSGACHGEKNKTPKPPHCKQPGTETNKECHRYP
ncbi:unnamed protein product [Prunus armeniaca]|uniref:Uncharacterized protein n=1 Tax=Prunus armeniaca TaxID=36596 RepID=A0A6J5XCT3_PRUAR|nr:unnamed protein product [Prunus armeniaca]